VSIFVLYQTKTFAADVNKAAGNPTRFTFPDTAELSVYLEAKDPKAFKDIAADPILQQQIHQRCQDQYKSLVKFFAGALQDINKSTDDDAEEAFKKAFSEGNLKQFYNYNIENMVAATKEVLAAQKNLEIDYKKYQVQVVAGISLTVGGMAVSIALIASTPFHFGAGTVIGIWGLAKSAVSLITMVADGLRSVDDSITDVAKTFIDVQAAFKKKHGAKKDLAKSVFNEVTQFLVASKFFDTLKESAEKLELAQNKLNGMELEWHAIGKKINKTLEKIDKIQEAQKLVEKDPQTYGKAAEKQKYKPADLQKLEDKLAKLISKNDSFLEKFKLRHKWMSDLTKWIEALLKEQKNEQKFLKILEESLKLADVLLAVAGAGDWSTLAEAAEEVVPGEASFFLDKAVAVAAGHAAAKSVDDTKKGFTAKFKGKSK
jgi:hypothetical protein